MALEIRTANIGDCARIREMMALSIETLQKGFLTDEQIQASHAGMGLDTQLIEDGTYFCVFDGNNLVGCGGWSYRATLYGGNHSAGRSAEKLDPKTDRARIRAMYTHPNHVRRGIGMMVIEASEAAAKQYGFSSLEMAATMAGVPFYLRCGYQVEKKWYDTNGAVPVPLCTMFKSI